MYRLRPLSGLLAFLALLGTVLVPLARPTAAAPVAQTNLLANGGFDGSYSGSFGQEVASSWATWHEDSGAKGACPPCNYALQPSWSPETNTALVQQGSASQHVGNQFDPWHGGVVQTVDVPAGTQVRFTAYIRVRASNEQWPAASYTNFVSNGQVGIDPNGNSTWNSGVSWSGTINPHDVWQPVSIEATVGSAGKVSVFISVNWKGQTAAHLDAWFDNASLVAVGSQPTAAPGQPTSTPAQGGAPAVTPFPTPTPGQDGRIVYVVKPGDSLWRIAAIAGLSVEELKAINNLSSDVVSVGQQLVLGTAEPPSAAPPATPTPQAEGGGAQAEGEPEGAQPPSTEVAETPPITGTGDVCYMLYEDINGNSLRDQDESLVAGGQFLITNANGQPVDAYSTTDDATQEPHCTRDLAAGGYNITIDPPDGYNSTTNAEFAFTLDAGATVNLEFGAQKSISASADNGEAVAPEGNDRLRTALFGAAGVIFLLLAAGLAGFLFISRRAA